jgi:parallel beta-helix repeat protein
MNRAMARSVFSGLVGLLAMAGSPSAGAADGRHEINQDCALAGCFPGDTAGFPVTISSSGSYVLVSDLFDNIDGTDAIRINAATAHAVSLDLNGFSIDGGGSCTGTPVTACAGVRGFNGIQLTQPAGTDKVLLTLRNGVVRGFQNYGLGMYGFAAGGAPLATGSLLENLTVSENGADGIAIEYEGGNDIQLNDVRLVRNGGRGAGSANNVTGTAGFRRVIAHGNGDNGISAPCGSSVVQSRLISNGAIGVAFAGASSGCTIALGDDVFGGNGTVAYSIPVLRNMGGVVCMEGVCP